MEHKIKFIIFQIILISLIASVQITSSALPPFHFKQVMPGGTQWMDYRPDEPNRAVILDGEGGAIVASVDYGSTGLLVQKIDRFGNVLWAKPGQARPVALNIYAPIMVSDGDGGVFITYAYANYEFNEVGYWYDYDVYVQHIARDFERRWGERGIPVAASDFTGEYPLNLITDGNGGLFILFYGPVAIEHPYGTVYLQHINQNGELLWPTPGKVMSAPDTLGVIRMIPDDDSGAFLFGGIKYAQHIDHEGQFCWSLPYMSTGLPFLWRQWIFRNNEEKAIMVAGYTGDYKHFAAQKISEENGTVLWGTEGKLWTPPNYDKIFHAIITPNGKGGAFIFYKHCLQELDADGNYLYETPISIIDTTKFQFSPFPVSGEYVEGLGTFILYVYMMNWNTAQVICQKLTPDRELPWGKMGITICDTTVFLNSEHSLMKIDPESNQAYIFLEFSRGIFVTKVDLATGLPVTKVESNHKKTPAGFRLTAYPNPFNSSTIIKYDLPESDQVSLKIFNIEGKLVTELVNKTQPAGTYQVVWDGKNSQQEAVTSGIYFCQFKTRQYWQTVRVILLR
jgi:hypothetical protein